MFVCISIEASSVNVIRVGNRSTGEAPGTCGSKLKIPGKVLPAAVPWTLYSNRGSMVVQTSWRMTARTHAASAIWEVKRRHIIQIKTRDRLSYSFVTRIMNLTEFHIEILKNVWEIQYCKSTVDIFTSFC